MGRRAHVVIIGAGPAGLATALCLARRGIGYTLLERGEGPAAALRRVDPEMRLYTPSRLSRLPGMRREPGEPTYGSFGALVARLERYREEAGLDIEARIEVRSVERTPEGFAVHCLEAGQGRVVHGSHVVNATGIVSAPRLPEAFDPGAVTLRWMHSLDVRAEHVAESRRLLVVGGGGSAADVLETWLRVHRPGDRAWIALRSPLRVLPHFILGIDFHYLAWLPEHLPAHPLGPLVMRKNPMVGTLVPRAIRRRVIERVPAVAGYQAAAVRLACGQVLEPDLLVLATGFRHATAHLGDLVAHHPDGWPIARKCESTRTPRLYLVGARFARTIASPYIRGIARDAAYVARRIAAGR